MKPHAAAARPSWALPQLSRMTMVALLVAIAILGVLLVDMAEAALIKLHLSPTAALLVVLAIFIGGFIHIPLKRFPREDLQPLATGGDLPLGLGKAKVTWTHSETWLAVNLGGGVIPLLLVAYELQFIAAGGLRPIAAMLLAVAVNISLCYRFSIPIHGVGIAIPFFLPPLAALAIAWILLSSPDYNGLRAPVAFVAGVLGPLVGADILHLRRLTELATARVSIGGAGTFDGIVLSGLLAALLA